jgi:hypothetical protein
MVEIVSGAMSGRDLFKGIIFIHHSYKKLNDFFADIFSLHDLIV